MFAIHAALAERSDAVVAFSALAYPILPDKVAATTTLFTFVPIMLFSGGLMIGAVYMATDMVTSPVTVRGQLIFGFGCGLVTLLIRQYGGYPEGVSFAILLMNAATPLIDRYTQPRVFGRGAESP